MLGVGEPYFAEKKEKGDTDGILSTGWKKGRDKNWGNGQFQAWETA